MGLFAMLLVAGCVSPPTVEQQKPPVTQPRQCTNITENVPVTLEECDNVSITEQVCGVRTLPYRSVDPPKVDLCIADGPCVGNPLGSCQACSKAMTRCMRIITNEDSKASGTWILVANFTFGSSGFNKEPITATIRPNESYTFDFYQIYVPGYPLNSATCTIYMVDEARVDDCHDETRLVTQCQNLTRTVPVQREVCQ